jgi:F420-0:gamma-glutamyl ligase
MGIAISFYGFNPLRNYVGKKDIFGRKLKMSQTNIADSLAATAVYTMGEGNEQSPIAIIEDAGKISFNTNKNKHNALKTSLDNDIYAPLLKSVKWKNRGKKYG